MDESGRERIFDGVVPESTSVKSDSVIAAVSEGLILGLQTSELISDDGPLPSTGLISHSDAEKVAEIPVNRIPKRILHFSDGILEEFSSDEEDVTDASAALKQSPNAQALLNPENLTWGPYVWYQVARFGTTTLSACDYLGEHLANFFGITSPKYQFEINEYLRMKAKEEEREKHDVEMASWKDSAQPQLNVGGDHFENRPPEPVATIQPTVDRERY